MAVKTQVDPMRAGLSGQGFRQLAEADRCVVLAVQRESLANETLSHDVTGDGPVELNRRLHNGEIATLPAVLARAQVP